MVTKFMLYLCMYVILSIFEYVGMHLVVITSILNTSYIQKIKFVMTKGSQAHTRSCFFTSIRQHDYQFLYFNSGQKCILSHNWNNYIIVGIIAIVVATDGFLNAFSTSIEIIMIVISRVVATVVVTELSRNFLLNVQ